MCITNVSYSTWALLWVQVLNQYYHKNGAMRSHLSRGWIPKNWGFLLHTREWERRGHFGLAPIYGLTPCRCFLLINTAIQIIQDNQVIKEDEIHTSSEKYHIIYQVAWVHTETIQAPPCWKSAHHFNQTKEHLNIRTITEWWTVTALFPVKSWEGTIACLPMQPGKI